MAILVTCSRCGDLYSNGSAACPTCQTPRTGTEVVTIRGNDGSPAGAIATPGAAQSVVVTDFDMPFGSMVTFMVKWAIAAIPAVIILFLLGMMLGVVFGGIFGGLMGH